MDWCYTALQIVVPLLEDLEGNSIIGDLGAALIVAGMKPRCTDSILIREKQGQPIELCIKIRMGRRVVSHVPATSEAMIFPSDLPSKRLSDDILESTRMAERSQDEVFAVESARCVRGGLISAVALQAPTGIQRHQPPQYELRPPWVDADSPTVTVFIRNLDLCSFRCCCMSVLLVISYTCELDPTSPTDSSVTFAV